MFLPPTDNKFVENSKKKLQQQQKNNEKLNEKKLDNKSGKFSKTNLTRKNPRWKLMANEVCTITKGATVRLTLIGDAAG